MPKRKRDVHDNGEDRSAKQKKNVYEKYLQSKKLLNRAFKTSKGFERQKLGKRLKIATAAVKADDMARIRREIDVLKGLEASKITEVHLNKTLMKIKAFAESDLLPEDAKALPPKPEGSEEMVTALHNVHSGMCNTKQVKEATEDAISGMYAVMGIPLPSVQKKVKEDKKEPVRGILKDTSAKTPAQPQELDEEGLGEGSALEELAWDGFESEGEEDDQEGKSEDGEESLDEEQISQFENLLGESSHEETDEEEDVWAKIRASITANPTREPLSLSPEPSDAEDSDSSSNSEQDEMADEETESDLDSSSESDEEPIPETKTKTSKSKRAPPPTRSAGSTFLPTLMGGYWSGSEEASDLEDDVAAVPAKKNRPGQMARRAIWEKKFGTGANHIKTGQGSVRDSKGGKDDGWDAKRGAKDSAGRGRGKGEWRKRDSRQVTGNNAMPIEKKKRGQGRKDDVGVLHPSWQAAKKAKEMKKTAKFEGKKVTFD